MAIINVKHLVWWLTHNENSVLTVSVGICIYIYGRKILIMFYEQHICLSNIHEVWYQICKRIMEAEIHIYLVIVVWPRQLFSKDASLGTNSIFNPSRPLSGTKSHRM